MPDDVRGVTNGTLIAMHKMAGTSCERRVKQCLTNQLEDEAIQRLRQNQPRFPSDLERVERVLMR